MTEYMNTGDHIRHTAFMELVRLAESLDAQAAEFVEAARVCDRDAGADTPDAAQLARAANHHRTSAFAMQKSANMARLRAARVLLGLGEQE